MFQQLLYLTLIFGAKNHKIDFKNRHFGEETGLFNKAIRLC